MVYTGKPSRACQTCKTRRIKCDEARPSCTHCVKSGRVCPGYKDDFDLVFRNENLAVAKRTERRHRVSRSESRGLQSVLPRSSSSSSSKDDAGISILSITSCPPSSSSTCSTFVTPCDSALMEAYSWWLGHRLPLALTPSIEVQATAFFFRNFVVPPQTPDAPQGYLELLLPLYNRSPASSPLQCAIEAVALAALGNYPGRSALLREAAVSYGRALQRVGEAIKDPQLSKQDETIVSVLMFSLYEAIISSDASGTAWLRHVDGAVTLTQLRGTEQFQDETSLRVFRAVRSMMLASCVRQAKPVDTTGWTTPADACDGNAANRLTVISMALPSLRARAQALLSTPPSPSSITEAHALLRAAQRVDGQFEAWAHALPDHWRPRIARIESHVPPADDPAALAAASAWPGPQHVYEDVFLACVTNDQRIGRIYCQTVILACCEHLDRASERSDTPPPSTVNATTHTYPRARARLALHRAVDDLCASVPFHTTYAMQARARDRGQDAAAAEGLGGYLLVWPLSVACRVAAVPARQRAWLRGRLAMIAAEFGLGRAPAVGLGIGVIDRGVGGVA